MWILLLLFLLTPASSVWGQAGLSTQSFTALYTHPTDCPGNTLTARQGQECLTVNTSVRQICYNPGLVGGTSATYCDQPAEWVNSGGTNVPLCGMVSCVPPNNASFSWVNQGTATIDTSLTNALYLLSPASSTGINARMLTVPGVPYTATLGLITQLQANYNGCGVMLYNNSTLALEIGYDISHPLNSLPGIHFKVEDYNSPTTGTFATRLDQPASPAGPMTWIRVQDNGTNRIWSRSTNGKFFEPVYTVNRAGFLNPTHVGFACASFSTATGASAVIRSWEITTP